MVKPYLALVAATGVERLIELRVSKRNIAWSLARGGRETGSGHYPVMVALHSGLLAGCAIEALAKRRKFRPRIGWPMLSVAVLAQGLRWWCITTLGRSWSTKIVVVPGTPLVRSGPYRYFSHPNYVAVIAEGVALPLVFDARITATAFTLLNAGLLTVRIKAENRALAGT
ncbi:hypothetical protein EH165_04725 [Nakamurella antarctica]|uniref:Alkylresorcinol O-methyltransferase n=1 Tax=Nakamurella antarctica TaxID=1902245 RepID=A0A3G8ZK48_9ACTN|nr:isoprenylcysteine carboxyl methyltransferase family protein [Nakamurella antarctica]AZI57568.1 hypothetical protein EH165_04725 [Nakamurella antarctica]